MVVGVGASPRPRPVRERQEGRARDHLHRRARRDRPLARRPRRQPRRPRRARADAQPDPHGDGRLHRLGGRHRPRRDEPARDPRPGAAAARAASTGASTVVAARQGRAQADPRGPLARQADRPPRSTSRRSPPRRRAWSAPTCATSSTRRRCRPRAAATSTIKIADFTNSLERIVLGAERRITISADERERTAYHESGHALLGMLEPGADPVRKVSIVPRGRALGVTFQSPDDRPLRLRRAATCAGRIVGALGGRAAEEIVYGNVTTGAESDLEQVTAIARQMVGRWGMSDKIGLVSVLPGPGDDPMFFPGTNGGPSEATRELVDERGPQDRRRVLRGRREPAAREPRPARGAGAGAARARDARRGRRVPRRRASTASRRRPRRAPPRRSTAAPWPPRPRRTTPDHGGVVAAGSAMLRGRAVLPRTIRRARSAGRERAVALCRRFNAGEADVLGELFGSLGEGAEIMAPLHCDYGTNITWGARSFMNWGADDPRLRGDHGRRRRADRGGRAAHRRHPPDRGRRAAARAGSSRGR